MTHTRFTFVALLLASVATTALSAPAPAPAPGAYRVVVNSANAASAMAREDVARLFLKKLTVWPAGQAAQPVDQSKQSAARKAFSQAVLGKDVSAVESYWQQAIFSGRSVPPPEKASDAEVLAFVRANPGAVGYVSGGADLGASVKELAVN
jgi:ABC-type phosphate transport system substrate-binding protein